MPADADAASLLSTRDAEGRAEILHALAHRAYPSYELFVFALLCGAILGLGYFFDSQAVLIFGILLAPLLTPWIGLLLSALTGSTRFFFETLAALLISSFLIFLGGLIAGFAVRAVLPRTLNRGISSQPFVVARSDRACHCRGHPDDFIRAFGRQALSAKHHAGL